MAANRLHDNLLIVSPEVIWVLKPIAPSKTTRKYNTILKTLPILVCVCKIQHSGVSQGKYIIRLHLITTVLASRYPLMLYYLYTCVAVL